jgi:glycosyltransferase involved in cell wall biosynthesis
MPPDASLTRARANAVETADRRFRTLVVIPALNEAPRLPGVLGRIRELQPAVDILVIDDGSTDDTDAVARDAGAFVVRHPFNLGYGAALQTGYKFAVQRHYEMVIQMDGDGQHDPLNLDAVMEPVQNGSADVVIGSRFLDEKSYRPPLERRIGSWIFGKLASLITGKRITDPTSGYWALNRKAFDLCAGTPFPHDYPDADVLIGLHHAGLAIAEVPVRMYPPERGKSMHRGLRPFYYVFKMSLSIFVAMLRERPGRSSTEP